MHYLFLIFLSKVFLSLDQAGISARKPPIPTGSKIALHMLPWSGQTPPSESGSCGSTLRAHNRMLHISEMRSDRPSTGNTWSCAPAHSSHMPLLPCNGFLYVAIFLALEALLQATLSLVPLALKQLSLPNQAFIDDLVCVFRLGKLNDH